MGTLETMEYLLEGTMVVSSSRPERVYGLCNSNDTTYSNNFWGNNKIPIMATFSHTHPRVAHGEVYTSSPAFWVITDKHLPQDALADLERIRFV